MKSLLDVYIAHRDDAHYYTSLICNPAHDFQCEDSAARVIRDYFNCGEKGNVFANVNYPRHRARHVLSTYYLGIQLSPLFQLDFNANGGFWLWLWFITCLYHDVGYEYECPIDGTQQLLSLSKFTKEELKHNLFSSVYYKPMDTNMPIIKKYYRYILKEKSHMDHGITGGLKLYSALSENYRRHWSEYKYASSRNARENYNHFTYNNLTFDASQFYSYARCANAIIEHNIWYAYKKNDVKEYGKYKLNPLIIDEKKKHLYADPLTALLVLCDTIEPIKRFPHCSPIHLLKNIGMEEEETKIAIHFLNPCMNPKDYIDEVARMANWSRCECMPTTDGITMDITEYIPRTN